MNCELLCHYAWICHMRKKRGLSVIGVWKQDNIWPDSKSEAEEGGGAQAVGYNKKNATLYAEPLAPRPPAASIPNLCFVAFSSSENQKINKTTFRCNWNTDWMKETTKRT